MTPSTTYTGSVCVVGREVSKQPPWSIATSTTTAPSFIPAIISRVTSFGASAPGIRTAPITRSAFSTDAAISSRELMSSVTRPDRISSRCRIRSIERSRIVTWAPRPSAMIAAL